MMRNKYILLGLCLLITCVVNATQTANSLPLSGSFLLRARGLDALYWNPAFLEKGYSEIGLPLFNQSYQVSNNSFDIDTYNYISGKYLTDKDKRRLLDNIDKAIVLNANTHVMLLGFDYGNTAFASSFHGSSRAKVSEDYVSLLLMGNEEPDYQFGKKDNQISAISYQDFTIGIGGIELSNLIKVNYMPEVKFGVATSVLMGLGVLETDYYKGVFHSGFDGMSLSQDLVLKTGIGGIGHKSLISFVNQPIDHLTLGMSLDNVLGYIKWFGRTDATHYTIQSDSIYASDLQSDLFEQSNTTKSVNSFVTKLPPEFRLGALINYNDVNLSVDWVQGFANSQITSSIGSISLGSEYYITPQIPIRAGLKFGNRDFPWSLSYGTGYKGRYLDFGFGLQTFSALIPGKHTQGIAFASSISIHN